MKRYIVFLAGGRWQEPWITYLKDRGHSIILVDPNENAVCRQHCDIYLKADVKNVEAIKQFIQHNGYTVEFFTSDQTDVSTLPVAELSEYFGTTGNSVQAVQRFTNKYLSREFVGDFYGTEHLPLFRQVRTSAEISEFMEQVAGTCILKPVDAQSSRGIFILNEYHSSSEIDAAITEALHYTKHHYLIIEEFVEGTEITIEGIITPDGHQILAASRKKHFRTGIASDLEYPLEISTDIWGKISNFHNALVNSTGLKMGITHSEYIVDLKNRRFYLIEMACRGGGSLIPSHLVPWVSGVNLYDLLYAQLTGGNAPEIDVARLMNKKAATLHFFEFPSGLVKKVSGLAEARKLEGVLSIDLEFDAGDVIYPANDDRSRQGFAILLADTIAEIEELKKEVYNRVKVEVTEAKLLAVA
jgi:biotin carboxylase